MSEIYIKSALDARSCIGQRVYWDDVSSRYVFLRCGLLSEVQGRNLMINEEWQSRSSLKNLRNFENGGEWKRHAQ